MAFDSAGHNLVDMVGNTLVVSDIQIASSSAVAGTGATGTSMSTTNNVTESLSGEQKVMTGQTTVAGGFATPAILIGSVGLGIYWGSGAPSSLTAVTGSMYLRTDGSSATNRTYICTGTSTWTAVTTVA